MTKSTEQKLSEGFGLFWRAYPRRQSKGDAWKAWQQQNCEPIADEIVKAVKKYPFSEDPKFIKLPGTFIRAWAWEDEFDNSGGDDNDW